MSKELKPQPADAAAPDLPGRSLFDRVAGYLDANEWNYQSNEQQGVFGMGCQLNDGSVRVILDLREAEDWQRVLCYSVFPVRVPELRREAVATSLARFNCDIAFGNLEMDLQDGEVRVRTTVESDRELGEPMIDRVLDANLGIANRVFAAILAVAFGDTAPQAAPDLLVRPDEATLQ